MVRRLSCLLSAFAVLFFVSVPAFATGMEMGGGGTGIPVGVGVQLDVVDFFNYCRDDLRYCWNSVRHVVDEDICPYAPQAGGRHKFNPARTLVDGQIGLYYQCEYCGRNYGEALDEAYRGYVETLPGKVVNSDGAFLWRPALSDFISQCGFRFDYSGSQDFYCEPSGFYTFGGDSHFSIVFVEGVSVKLDKGTRSSLNRFVYSWGRVRLPVTGYYTDVEGVFNNYSGPHYFRNILCSAGDSLVLPGSNQCSSSSSGVNYYGLQIVEWPWPAFWVMPVAGDSANTYKLDARVSGSADGGMFGYVQDGMLYQSSVTNIYNESTGAYQNPVTGNTETISSWSYDYSDRSYTLTTDESETITLTYGDSNVMICEGGTTYNVYYLMEETQEIQEELESVCVHAYSSAVTTPPTCMASGVKTFTCSECGSSYTQTVPPTGHDYQSAVTMAPTCVGTGVRTFTCSECGDSYTVSISATGHMWQVISTVPTVYDSETGQLVQQGYTLYECATCHEQYRISADSGGSSLPAPSSGGTSTGGADLLEIDSDVGRGFLAIIAHGLTEDLPEAVQAASSWFVELPALYQGYTSFLSASMSWLPHDIQVLMTFSVGMVTFIGIIRKIWG